MTKNIPIEFLRSFITIAELSSFTQAGEKLARTQSAISLQIKKLEELLGQPVFDRQGHNFELTESGKILMRYATQILQLNDSLLGELDRDAIVGKVRLGIPSEFAIALLPKIVGSFARQNPQITLEVTCDLSRNLSAGLKKQQYDVVLSLHDVSTEPMEGNDGGKNRYVKEDKLVWVSAPHFNINQYSSLPLIVAPEGCIYRNRAVKALDKASVPWQVIYTIMDLSGIKSAIEEGLGITVLAESTVPGTLKVIPPPFASSELGSIGISLLTSQTNGSSVAASVLADYLKLHLR